MKILVVSDKESRKIWDFYEPGMLYKYDLILSCGDLNPHYMQFLATMSRAEVLYVHGNHDEKYEKIPPEGCECIDDRIYNFRGLRILGLGGCMRYKDDAKFQCTEKEMERRIRKLRFRLKRTKGFDILIAHAPARGLHDGSDLPHRGFQAFIELMDEYHPKYFLHGHVHKDYSDGYKKVSSYGDTVVINAYETYELEIPDEEIRTPKGGRVSVLFRGSRLHQ
ncbi:MAG: metallophosphoesterase family protein [Lachnospiraceae bacterium]|nr:metallophosphoesterase family protein [Lachnospiraceae bacterium]